MTETERQAEPSVSVVVVDDDARTADTIGRHLRRMKCEVRVFTDPRECLHSLAETPADIVVTDLQMPVVDGITLLKDVKETTPSTDVIIVTGNADKSVAIQALKLGAFDFFEKPVDGVELTETVKRTVRYRQVVQERDRLADQLSFLSRREATNWGIDSFVGKSAAIKRILKQIQLVQKASSTSVLVLGESGTGKELVARAIHFGSPRSSRPFIPVNCSAIPGELAESMLFGHTRGSFTGATASRKGCFEMADGGTLFLDEIGDMPPAMQTKLLRVLEDGIVTPVGASKGNKVDVRVIAATNANIQERIADGGFRSDLFYRLAIYTISLPPLRDRKEEIPLLARHFAQRFSSELGIPTPVLEPRVLDVLQSHSFPGNVRELKNVVERAVIESSGQDVRASHLHFLSVSPSAGLSPSAVSVPRTPGADAGGVVGSGLSASDDGIPFNLQKMEAILIRKAMSKADENVSAAARLLGINRTKLYRKLAAMQDQDGSS